MDETGSLNEAQAAWQEYDDRQKFEHELLNRKMTWLLTSQTVLFAAYGVTFGDAGEGDGLESFRRMVTLTGILIAAVVLVGTAALLNSKRLSWRSYRTYFGDPSETPSAPVRDLRGPLKNTSLQWGVNTVNTWWALLPDVCLPVIFVVVWWVIY